jgi:hypothetical protein
MSAAMEPMAYRSHCQNSQVKKRLQGSKPSTILQSPQPPSPPQISPVTLLRRSIQKWGHTLVSVSIRNDHTTSFSMPCDVFETLLLRPDMKHLKITGIGIDSMDSTLRRLKEVANFKLEDLHLPAHSTAPGIAPELLRDIAEACPLLKSLRCRLCALSVFPVSLPLSHQLQELIVSNEQF